MTREYNKQTGRLRLETNPAWGMYHFAKLSCPTGWNDSCPVQTMTFSEEELHDLRHMINRVLGD